MNNYASILWGKNIIMYIYLVFIGINKRDETEKLVFNIYTV